MSSPAECPYSASERGRGFGAAAALTFALLVAACDLNGPPSREQVAWAKSPDGLTHAILIETNGGATTPFGYLVELHPADHQGQAPVRAVRLMSATSQCARGVELRWLDPGTLALRYVSASRIDMKHSVAVGNKTVRIVAQKETRNPAASCDGATSQR